MSVCAKIIRQRRQPLNSSVRPHEKSSELCAPAKSPISVFAAIAVARVRPLNSRYLRCNARGSRRSCWFPVRQTFHCLGGSIYARKLGLGVRHRVGGSAHHLAAGRLLGGLHVWPRHLASAFSGLASSSITSNALRPNYSFKRTAATGCATIMRCAAAAA